MVVKLNKNSWHYRLCKFAEININQNNFCDYFKSVICAFLDVLGLSFVFFMIGFVPVFLLHIAFLENILLGLTFLVICGCIGLWVWIGIDITKQLHIAKITDNIFVTKYKSMKEKYCPGIEWVE